MARICCFIDTLTLRQHIQQYFAHTDDNLQMSSASLLNRAVRTKVQQFTPDLILMELSKSIDNPHIFFFLRSDCTTRQVPIIVFSNSVRLAEEAHILGADAHLPRDFTASQFHLLLQRFLQNKLRASAA